MNLLSKKIILSAVALSLSNTALQAADVVRIETPVATESVNKANAFAQKANALEVQKNNAKNASKAYAEEAAETKKAQKAAQDDQQDAIEDANEEIQEARGFWAKHGKTILAIGGTVVVTAAIVLGLVRYFPKVSNFFTGRTLDTTGLEEAAKECRKAKNGTELAAAKAKLEDAGIDLTDTLVKSVKDKTNEKDTDKKGSDSDSGKKDQK